MNHHVDINMEPVEILLIEELMEEEMEKDCDCATTNKRLHKIDTQLAWMACCPRCCHCHWDKIEEEMRDILNG